MTRVMAPRRELTALGGLVGCSCKRESQLACQVLAHQHGRAALGAFQEGTSLQAPRLVFPETHSSGAWWHPEGWLQTACLSSINAAGAACSRWHFRGPGIQIETRCHAMPAGSCILKAVGVKLHPCEPCA